MPPPISSESAIVEELISEMDSPWVCLRAKFLCEGEEIIVRCVCVVCCVWMGEGGVT